MAKKSLHKAWIILVICCLSQGAAIGIAANCAGLFYEPASQELGCSMAAISLFLTIISLSQFVCMTTFTRKLFFKFKPNVVMIIAAILISMRALLAFSTSVWQWWVIGAISGVGVSFLNGFASSIILERWFYKKFPTALSLVATFSGIFGIVMSLVIGVLIQKTGWRTAILLSHTIILVLEIPTLFIVLNPYEKNMNPFGASDEQYAEIRKELESSPNGAKKEKTAVPFSGKMILVLVLCFFNASFTSFIAHLSPFGYSVNFKFNPSLLVTCNMAGNMFFKMIYGTMVEKTGLKKSSVFMLILNLAGCLLLFAGKGVALLAGAFLFGSSALVYTSMIPLIERHFFNSAEYPVVIQRGMALYSICFASFSFIYGMIRDSFNSYTVVIAFMIVTTAINIILLSISLKKTK